MIAIDVCFLLRVILFPLNELGSSIWLTPCTVPPQPAAPCRLQLGTCLLVAGGHGRPTSPSSPSPTEFDFLASSALTFGLVKTCSVQVGGRQLPGLPPQRPSRGLTPGAGPVSVPTAPRMDGQADKSRPLLSSSPESPIRAGGAAETAAGKTPSFYPLTLLASW